MKNMTAARDNILSREAVYNFEDEHGNLLFQKVRFRTDGKPPRNKTFRYRYVDPLDRKRAEILHMSQPEYTWRKPDDADRYPYRLPGLLAAKAEGNDIWWCEGEKDANRLEEEFVTAISHHGGAGKITQAQADWFAGHTGRVILCYDRDPDGPDGSNPGAYDVIKRYDLLRYMVRLKPHQLIVVGPAIGKDIHDHLSAGLGLRELVPVTDLTELREKEERSRGNGLGWAGYGDPETLALGEALGVHGEGWKPQVRRGRA